MTQKVKVAIVTGGSSGIGQAACIALSEAGFHVVVVGMNSERINHTLNLLSTPTNHQFLSPHLGLKLNVTIEADMQEMVRKTMDHFGRIDLLLVSAGIGKKTNSARIVPHPTADLPLEEWNEVLNVNLTGVFLSNRAVLPVMRSQKYGQIINISSSTGPHGLRGTPFAPAYCASKFGIVGFSESLAQEVCGDGIRVQVLFPGHVETPLTAGTGLSRLYGGSMSLQSVANSIVYLAQHELDSVIVHSYLIPLPKISLGTTSEKPIG